MNERIEDGLECVLWKKNGGMQSVKLTIGILDYRLGTLNIPCLPFSIKELMLNKNNTWIIYLNKQFSKELNNKRILKFGN